MNTNYNPITEEEIYDLDNSMSVMVEGQRQWIATRVYHDHIRPFCEKHGLRFETTRTHDSFWKEGKEMSNNELDDLEGGSTIRKFLCHYFQDDLLISDDTLPFLTFKNKREEEPPINPDELPF